MKFSSHASAHIAQSAIISTSYIDHYSVCLDYIGELKIIQHHHIAHMFMAKVSLEDKFKN